MGNSKKYFMKMRLFIGRFVNRFWSFPRLAGHLLGYWIARSGGLFFFYLLYKWQKEIRIKNLLRKHNLNNYSRIKLNNIQHIKKDRYDGIFLSRYEFQKKVKLNKNGIFIIPRSGERAEIALLRYLAVVRDIGCDVFVYNKPSRGKNGKINRFAELKRIVECFTFFQLKIGFLNEERIFILTESQNKKLALTLSKQVETKGIVLDFTRNRRPLKRWQGLIGKVRFLSLVNIVASIFEKTETLSDSTNQIVEILAPLVLISRKDKKERIAGYFEYKFGNLKDELMKLALKVKEVEFNQEFRETILSVVYERRSKNSLKIYN
ncbi:MAG: hypothetical protein KGD64_06155 [Candidatus Heimdallarchaeota archaeon]|nr:hypothetical protein [Candidatus Heimdallarchaeota archaeon]